MKNWRKILSWQTQLESTNNTSALFTSYVSRKPGTWLEAKVVNFNQLDTTHQDALMHKRVIEMHLPTPDAYFPDNPNMTEFILHNQYDGFQYYVDTSGHNYARYVFRILNFPN